MATYAEQIGAFEAKHAANVATMKSLMDAAGEKGETLDSEAQDQFDDLEQENASIQKHLNRLRAMEKMAATEAKPVEGTNGKAASEARDARAPAQVKTTEKLAPGVRMARVVKCLGRAQGNRSEALEIAKSLYQNDESVVNVMKAAVAAGTTSNTTWVGNLVGDETSVYADFIEYLRPMTILGKFGTDGIPSLRNVPFRVALVGQTSGGAGYWVGEGNAKPLTKFDFSRTTLEPLKVANIAVLTMEAVLDSSPSADLIVRDQLVAALRERLDIDFINPAKSASAGVSPASITNGITPIASAGIDADAVRRDMRALFSAFIAANNVPSSGVWIMTATQALSLSLMLNPLGQSEFPGINMNGGTLNGMPVIVSEHVPEGTVALVNAGDIYLGDEGGFSVDVSREASLQMDDTPDNPTSATTVMVSLWQRNMMGFLAERTINWARRRDSSVQLLSGVNWGGDAS